jgi:hypothetical protein
MSIVFAIAVIAGLLLTVRVMLFGVERPRDFGETAERSFRVSPVVIAVGLMVFGLVGYPVVRSGGSTAVAVIAALAAAVVAGAVMVPLVRRWWAVTPEHDVDDPRYVLQGHLAHVVLPIGTGEEGEVAFDVGTTRQQLRARAVDDLPLAAGTEVVIERIEDDVAYVEGWHEVEKRL